MVFPRKDAVSWRRVGGVFRPLCRPLTRSRRPPCAADGGWPGVFSPPFSGCCRPLTATLPAHASCTNLSLQLLTRHQSTQLHGFTKAKPKQLFRRFVETAGTVEVQA